MAITTTSTTGAGVLDIANQQVGLQFGPKATFARSIIENGRQHNNAEDAKPGDPVKFYNYGRLQPNSDTLSETADGNPETVNLTANSVTLLEKGNFVTTTEKLRSLSFNRLMGVADLIATNAAESTDKYAMEVAETNTDAEYNTYVGGTAKSTISATNKITADIVRETHAKLEGRNVPKIETEFGDYYLWFIHPDVMYDLKDETGDGAFRNALIYRDQMGANSIIKGEYGIFEGFRFIINSGVKTDYLAGEEKQSATTIASSASVGATTISLTDATGITAGNVINITVGSDEWAYKVISVSTNDVTIGKAIRKNGFIYYASSAGLQTALDSGEDVEESSVVYSNYVLGNDAFGYAYAKQPEIITNNDPDDFYERLQRVGWYALHGIDFIRPEAMQKVFCSSSINPNG